MFLLEGRLKSHISASVIKATPLTVKSFSCREAFVFDCSSAEKKPKNSKEENR